MMSFLPIIQNQNTCLIYAQTYTGDQTRIRPLEYTGTCLCVPKYMVLHRLHIWKGQSPPPW